MNSQKVEQVKDALRTPCTENELRWIQVTAGITSLIGVIGLIALMSQGAWAEEPKGFQPGSKSFNPFATPTNPSGAAQPARPSFFPDDEEDMAEDEEEFDVPARGVPSSPSAPSMGSRGTPKSGGDENPLSMGGSNYVISKNQAPSIQIATETGEGSKEIVTDFNFPDADILDIAKTLGKLTGKNFILDKDVKGRITIISNSPITVSDAWKAFLTALDMNGFAMIPSGKYIRIARHRDARDKQLKTYTGEFSPDTDALITRVFQLKYIDADEVARAFRSFMPANSRIIPHDQTNTVIVTDTGSNIAKLNKLLEILDIEGYDLGIEVIPVKYASAAELSKLIDTLIPGTAAGGGAGAPGVPRFGATGGTRFSARRTKEGGVINTIIADERTNTLIVNANGKGTEQVRELVAKLDQKLPVQRGGGKIHVMYLQFADAEQISTTLNNLSQQVGGGFRTAMPTGGTGTGVNPVQASLFEGAIKVAPDKATNSLVITASPSDFVTIQRVVNRLDIPRDEVYVEVVIMEVALSRSFNYSSGVIAPGRSPPIGLTPNTDLVNFLTNPLAQTGAILAFGTSDTKTFTVNGQSVTVPNVAGLIKAIQGNTKANILATPQIIALDNAEANFESAEKIPVPSSTAVQGAGVTQSYTKESVALSIKIKPQINKISNFVKLDVTAKLGDVNNQSVPAALQGQVFGTLERTAQTTVVVGDSDTVVLGGLIRDKVSESINKIPLLGDIPVLGWLFRSKNSSVEKTNLLIFMTPRIVRKYDKVRAILDKKLKERDEFLEKEAGGHDPLRPARDDIIRGLPDLKEIMATRETSVTLDDDTMPAARPVEPEAPFTDESRGAQKTPPSTGLGVPESGSLAPSAQPQAPVAPPAPEPPAPPADSVPLTAPPETPAEEIPPPAPAPMQ